MVWQRNGKTKSAPVQLSSCVTVQSQPNRSNPLLERRSQTEPTVFDVTKFVPTADFLTRLRLHQPEKPHDESMTGPATHATGPRTSSGLPPCWSARRLSLSF